MWLSGVSRRRPPGETKRRSSPLSDALPEEGTLTEGQGAAVTDVFDNPENADIVELFQQMTDGSDTLPPHVSKLAQELIGKVPGGSKEELSARLPRPVKPIRREGV